MFDDEKVKAKEKCPLPRRTRKGCIAHVRISEPVVESEKKGDCVRFVRLGIVPWHWRHRGWETWLACALNRTPGIWKNRRARCIPVRKLSRFSHVNTKLARRGKRHRRASLFPSRLLVAIFSAQFTKRLYFSALVNSSLSSAGCIFFFFQFSDILLPFTTLEMIMFKMFYYLFFQQ